MCQSESQPRDNCELIHRMNILLEVVENLAFLIRPEPPRPEQVLDQMQNLKMVIESAKHYLQPPGEAP